MAYPLSSTDISFFSPEISKFCLIKKYMHRFHVDTKLTILLTFLESIKIVLIKKIAILVTSVKMAPPDFLKVKIF